MHACEKNIHELYIRGLTFCMFDSSQLYFQSLEKKISIKLSCQIFKLNGESD